MEHIPNSAAVLGNSFFGIEYPFPHPSHLHMVGPVVHPRVYNLQTPQSLEVGTNAYQDEESTEKHPGLKCQKELLVLFLP